MKGRITAVALCFLAANPITASPAIATWSPEAQACSDRKGELEVVLDACTRAILSGVLNQDQLPKTFNNRGLIFYRKGDIDQVIKSFDQTVRLKPDLAEAFIDRALANAAKGQHSSALRDHDQALRLEPDKTATLFNRGTQYLNSGEPAVAKKDFRRLLELESTNPDAEKRLAAAIERQRLAGSDKRPILAAEGGKLPAKLETPPAQSPARVTTPPAAPAVDNVEIAARIKRTQSLRDLGQLRDGSVNPPAGLVQAAIATFQRYQGSEANNGWLTGAELAELHTRARYNRSVTRQPLPPVSSNDLQRRHRRGEVEATLLPGQMFDPSFVDAGQQKDATDWLKKAAEKGNGAAQYALVELYREAKDEVSSRHWFEKAVAQADGGAASAQVRVLGGRLIHAAIPDEHREYSS